METKTYVRMRRAHTENVMQSVNSYLRFWAFFISLAMCFIHANSYQSTVNTNTTAMFVRFSISPLKSADSSVFYSTAEGVTQRVLDHQNQWLLCVDGVCTDFRKLCIGFVFLQFKFLRAGVFVRDFVRWFCKCHCNWYSFAEEIEIRWCKSQFFRLPVADHSRDIACN